jgi:hypothetical protein
MHDQSYIKENFVFKTFQMFSFLFCQNTGRIVFFYIPHPQTKKREKKGQFSCIFQEMQKFVSSPEIFGTIEKNFSFFLFYFR